MIKWPSKLMLPSRIGTKPISDLSKVVLPTPLRPSKTVICPAWAVSDTSRKMCEPP